MAITNRQSGSEPRQRFTNALRALPRSTTGQAGVTLIEMLIVVAIIGIVSSILMFNYSDFSSNVSLRNLSQEMALTIRKAQTYATSVRTIEGLPVIINSEAYSGYGMAFRTAEDVDDIAEPGNKAFVLFADLPESDGIPNGRYGGQSTGTCGTLEGPNSECIELFNISTADKIAAICASPNGGDWEHDPKDCLNSSSKVDTVDVTFRRPSPDAHILGVNNTPYTFAQIVIESPKQTYRSITVWNTGQVSTQ